MAEIVHLVIERGVDVDKGRNISVRPEGARLGRASKNDIVLVDPLLSRHHCRLFFKADGGLWITDLGSANECLVNDKPVQEAALNVGDLITIGGTVLRVLNNGITSVGQKAQAQVPQQGPSPAIPSVAPAIDLGLQKKECAPRKIGLGPLVLIACIVIILAGLAWFPQILKKMHGTPAPLPPEVVPQTLEVEYEKIQATTANIFAYRLQIKKDNMMSMQIDDIENNRHVRPQEKKVENKLIQSLTRTILDSGFFALAEEYKGIQPDVLEVCDLSITIGRKTHRIRVVNRVQPEALDNLTKALEEFAKNELGAWAVQVPVEKLVEMANKALLQGKKLYTEKEINYGNLANSIKSFQEAEGYLETVEPKPDFYAEIISSMRDYKQELQGKYDDENFKIERAIRLKEWEEAARELRIVCDMIPDRSDPRNQEARKKLLDVERRIDIRK
jgi:hypothetical protein